MPLAQSQGKLLSGSERSTEVWEEVRTRDLAGNDVMIGSIAHAKGCACGEHPTVPASLMIGVRESTALSKVRARVLRGFGSCASTSRM